MSGSPTASIEEVHRRWLAHELAGEPLAVLDLCAEDVLWLVAGEGALRGIEAVRGWLAAQPPVTIESVDITELAIELSGSLAVKSADFRTRLRVPGQTEPIEVSGSHQWTLRRAPSSDGWKVASVAWALR